MDLRDLPNKPAVYVMYGGSGRSRHAAYVGMAGKLRRRIDQHLISRDSSVTTGMKAAMLNPNFVSEVEWWEHAAFDDRDQMAAAELLAFDHFEPTLRSRGSANHDAQRLAGQKRFRARMQKLFSGAPTGVWIVPSMRTVLHRVAEIEKRLEGLERRLVTDD